MAVQRRTQHERNGVVVNVEPVDDVQRVGHDARQRRATVDVGVGSGEKRLQRTIRAKQRVGSSADRNGARKRQKPLVSGCTAPTATTDDTNTNTTTTTELISVITCVASFESQVLFPTMLHGDDDDHHGDDGGGGGGGSKATCTPTNIRMCSRFNPSAHKLSHPECSNFHIIFCFSNRLSHQKKKNQAEKSQCPNDHHPNANKQTKRRGSRKKPSILPPSIHPPPPSHPSPSSTGRPPPPPPVRGRKHTRKTRTRAPLYVRNVSLHRKY